MSHVDQESFLASGAMEPAKQIHTRLRRKAEEFVGAEVRSTIFSLIHLGVHLG